MTDFQKEMRFGAGAVTEAYRRQVVRWAVLVWMILMTAAIVVLWWDLTLTKAYVAGLASRVDFMAGHLSGN